MTSSALVEVAPLPTERRRWRGRRRSSWGLRIGVGIVGLYALVAVLAPLIAPDDPLRQDIPHLLQRPSSHHLVGTDALGRDVLSRLMYATRYDLVLAAGATGLALLVGTAVGLLAGYFRRAVDLVLGRIFDLMLTVPTYPLLVLLLFVLGSGTRAVIIAFAVTDWVGYARLTRSQVLVVREQDYIAAARLGALSHLRVMRRHVLPNVTTQVLTLWAADLVIAIGAIAALGFLGIGIQPPTPEWGVIIVEGQDYILTNWWLAVAPGVVIVIFGVGLALIADAITGRDRRR